MRSCLKRAGSELRRAAKKSPHPPDAHDMREVGVALDFGMRIGPRSTCRPSSGASSSTVEVHACTPEVQGVHACVPAAGGSGRPLMERSKLGMRCRASAGSGGGPGRGRADGDSIGEANRAVDAAVDAAALHADAEDVVVVHAALHAEERCAGVDSIGMVAAAAAEQLTDVCWLVCWLGRQRCAASLTPSGWWLGWGWLGTSAEACAGVSAAVCLGDAPS